jgi:AraC-like DNA-binding protein
MECLSVTGIDSVLELKTDQKNWRSGERPFHCIAISLEGVTDHFFLHSPVLTHKPGLIFFIPAMADYIANSSSSFIHSIALHFYINEDLKLDPALYLAGDNKRLELLFRESLNRYARKEPGWYFRINQILYDIIATLAEKQSRREPRFIRRKRLAPAIEKMHDGLADPSLSIEDMASVLRLSRAHFERLFMEAYNVTPSEYLRNLRIEHAKDLLRGSFYNVSEIAYMSGFGDLYYFSKVFKKAVGMSPLEYRRSS